MTPTLTGAVRVRRHVLRLPRRLQRKVCVQVSEAFSPLRWPGCWPARATLSRQRVRVHSWAATVTFGGTAMLGTTGATGAGCWATGSGGGGAGGGGGGGAGWLGGGTAIVFWMNVRMSALAMRV